jgi:hypothetical protein
MGADRYSSTDMGYNEIQFIPGFSEIFGGTAHGRFYIKGVSEGHFWKFRNTGDPGQRIHFVDRHGVHDKSRNSPRAANSVSEYSSQVGCVFPWLSFAESYQQSFIHFIGSSGNGFDKPTAPRHRRKVIE